MEDPVVWAVVINWNGKELLGPCLRTLLDSDYAALRTLVVDNASSDGSVPFVKETFPSVAVAANDTNLGYAAGANEGLRRALEGGADYVLLLNNDVELDRGAVSALVEAARARPDAAFIGPMIYYADPPDVIWSAGGAVSYWTGDIRHLGLREKDTGQYTETRDVDYVTGCAVLASTEAVRAIGLMDENYFMYNEDTDWCVRARAHGYAVLFAPKARLWHRVSMSSGGGLTPFKVYHRLRSTLRFFSIHARPYHWLGIVPLTAWRVLCFSIGQLVSGGAGNVGAVVRGLVHTLTGRART